MSLFILRDKSCGEVNKWWRDFLSPCFHFLLWNGGGSAEPQHRHNNSRLGGDEMFMLRHKLCCLFVSDTAIWPSDGNVMISFVTGTEMIKRVRKVQKSSCNGHHSFSRGLVTAHSLQLQNSCFKTFLRAVGGMPSRQYLIIWHDTF